MDGPSPDFQGKVSFRTTILHLFPALRRHVCSRTHDHPALCLLRARSSDSQDEWAQCDLQMRRVGLDVYCAPAFPGLRIGAIGENVPGTSHSPFLGAPGCAKWKHSACSSRKSSHYGIAATRAGSVAGWCMGGAVHAAPSPWPRASACWLCRAVADPGLAVDQPILLFEMCCMCRNGEGLTVRSYAPSARSLFSSPPCPCCKALCSISLMPRLSTPLNLCARSQLLSRRMTPSATSPCRKKTS